MKPLLLIIVASFSLHIAPSARAAEAYALTGQKIILTVTSDGTPPFTYQWKKDGVNIPGATASTYVIASATPADAANYTVQVSNKAGGVASDTAAITIIVSPTKAITGANVGTS